MTRTTSVLLAGKPRSQKQAAGRDLREKQTTRRADVAMATTPLSPIGHVARRLPEHVAKMGLGPVLRTAKND